MKAEDISVGDKIVVKTRSFYAERMRGKFGADWCGEETVLQLNGQREVDNDRKVDEGYER